MVPDERALPNLSRVAQALTDERVVVTHEILGSVSHA